MRPRLQFSLKTLLISLVLACLGHGVWHRYVWAPHIELRPGASGQRHVVEHDISLAAEPGSYEIWLKPQALPEIRSRGRLAEREERWIVSFSPPSL